MRLPALRPLEKVDKQLLGDVLHVDDFLDDLAAPSLLRVLEPHFAAVLK